MSKLKTYSHLNTQKRVPTEYEIATSNLLYYTKNGFETDGPIQNWYTKYQRNSPFQCKDWSTFKDPRETTYQKYLTIQKSQENFIQNLFYLIENKNYDQQLSMNWLQSLELWLAPLIYPLHGIQMITSYVAQMAPEGRLVISLLFQSADEMRRIQHITYRIFQIKKLLPKFAEMSKSQWENNLLWQPLRKLIEELLVVYDWGEAFIVLNYILKPRFDHLFMKRLSQLADENKDYVLSELLFSFNEDCKWHKSCCDSVIQFVVNKNPSTDIAIQNWTKLWEDRVISSLAPFEEIFACYQRK